MAGLDFAEISATAWPSLHDGVHGMVTVADPEVHAAMRELHRAGLVIGDCGAATLAALRALATEAACSALREAVALGAGSRVLLIATEGATDTTAYRATVAGA
jgi:diaminopropionate ammonia-lyase